MTDVELLRAAIAASGITSARTGEPSTRGFALRVLKMDDGSARDVLAGKRRLMPLQRAVCLAVVRWPVMARRLDAVDPTA